jgi:hypothetical protein
MESYAIGCESISNFDTEKQLITIIRKRSKRILGVRYYSFIIFGTENMCRLMAHKNIFLATVIAFEPGDVSLLKNM